MISTPKGIENPLSEPLPDVSGRQSSSWDINNAPRNYGSLVAFQIGSAVFSFASIWLITHYLGSEGYGGIVAVIAASQVAQVFVNWTSVAVVRFGVDEFISTEKIARTFWVRFIVLSINLAIVLASSPLWFPPLAQWLKLSPGNFGLVLTHVAVTVLWIHVQMSLQAAKLPSRQGFLMMVERLMILAGLFTLTAYASLSGYWAMTCYIAAPGVMIVIGFYTLRNYIFAPFSVDRAFIRTIIAYSLPLLPFSFVAFFSGSYADAVFVTKFLTTSDLGIYSVATQINGIAVQLPTLANTLLLPLFVTLRREGTDQRTVNYFRNVLPSLTLLWGLGCAFVSFGAFFIFPFFFKAEFMQSIPPLVILFCATAVSLPFFLGFSAMAQSASLVSIQMYSAILAACTNIVFNFLLIPQYGLVGCAWSTVITYLVNVLLTAFAVGRKTAMPISWSIVAMIPILVFGLSYSIFDNILLSLASCVTLSLMLAYQFRTSVLQAVAFMKKFSKVID